MTTSTGVVTSSTTAPSGENSEASSGANLTVIIAIAAAAVVIIIGLVLLTVYRIETKKPTMDVPLNRVMQYNNPTCEFRARES